MGRDIIKLQFPVLDHTESVANIKINVTNGAIYAIGRYRK